MSKWVYRVIVKAYGKENEFNVDLVDDYGWDEYDLEYLKEYEIIDKVAEYEFHEGCDMISVINDNN